MRGFRRTSAAISSATFDRIARGSWRRGMTSLEIDGGSLHTRAVECTATELVVTLVDGRKIATPLDWYPRLQRASAKERANFEIMPMGIHWPDLDEDLGIAGMLKGRRA